MPNFRNLNLPGLWATILQIKTCERANLVIVILDKEIGSKKKRGKNKETEIKLHTIRSIKESQLSNMIRGKATIKELEHQRDLSLD